MTPRKVINRAEFNVYKPSSFGEVKEHVGKYVCQNALNFYQETAQCHEMTELSTISIRRLKIAT